MIVDCPDQRGEYTARTDFPGSNVLNGPMFPLQKADDHDRQNARHLSTHQHGRELPST